MALVPDFGDNALPFSGFLQLDNDLEVCQENADDHDKPYVVQEDESDPQVEKPSRAEVLAAFETFLRFSQTSGEIEGIFDDQLNNNRKLCLEHYLPSFT